jgi:transposase
MLDQSKRTAILELRNRGHGVRTIARALGVSRRTVRDVIASGSAEVPHLDRAEKAEPYREQILELHAKCAGNLVLVHEGLLAQGAKLSYPAVTGFCRRHGIGYEPPKPAGHYTFAPGQEMQHDTSPHDVKIGGVLRRVQTASLVLAWSRMIFIQLYPTFTRFDCKVFLTDAFHYIDGTCRTCMIDNSHIVVLRGTGANMVPVPEMAAFAERFDFTFKAHELGDANRSAQVEAHFNYVEGNFVRSARTFADFADLNRQAVEWCDHVNAKPSRRLHGSRRELFAAERPHLRPLPLWVPPVYRLYDRIVDVEGYVSVHANRYSVPYQLIGRRLEVRETKDHIEVFHGPRLVATHRRLLDPLDTRVTLTEHRPPRGEGRSARHGCSVEEEAILKIEPRLAPYVAALKAKVGGQAVLPLRRLRRLLRDYPREPFLDAVQTALQYGLYDLERLERMVLRRVGQQYFVLPGMDDDPEDDDEEE